MSLTALLIVAVIFILFIMFATIASVNRAYAFKHTVDEKPVQDFNKNQN